MNCTIREISLNDIPYVVDYFLNANASFLRGMGADKNKLPARTDWVEQLTKEFHKPPKEKSYLYFIWLLNDRPIGHSNVNNIHYGKHALMHLHIWHDQHRNKGLGTTFLKLTIPHYFNILALQTLICEPYAQNPAPNKTLTKLGFSFMKSYETTPGPINLKQVVSRYEITKEQSQKLMY